MIREKDPLCFPSLLFDLV